MIYTISILLYGFCVLYPLYTGIYIEYLYYIYIYTYIYTYVIYIYIYIQIYIIYVYVTSLILYLKINLLKTFPQDFVK